MLLGNKFKNKHTSNLCTQTPKLILTPHALNRFCDSVMGLICHPMFGRVVSDEEILVTTAALSVACRGALRSKELTKLFQSAIKIYSSYVYRFLIST